MVLPSNIPRSQILPAIQAVMKNRLQVLCGSQTYIYVVLYFPEEIENIKYTTVFLWRFGRNLVAFYHKFCLLIG